MAIRTWERKNSTMTALVESSDTVAVLTPRGRGAVATLRLRSDASILDRQECPLFRAANGKPMSSQTLGRIVFGRWGLESAEDVVLCRRDETTLEIHCHGGDAAVQRILEDLQAVGCAIVPWFEQEQDRTGVLAAECWEAVSRAPTLCTASILLEQSGGTLQAAFAALEKVGLDEAGRASCLLNDLRSWAEFGLHLTQSWRVVLCGRPNVGKSSLLNALVGYGRSIVYNEPGTTRDVVTAETAFQGWPVQLIDTAGLRDEATGLEAAGIERARDAMATADCAVLVLDTSAPPTEDDRALLAELTSRTRNGRNVLGAGTTIVVAHKSDLPNVWGEQLPVEAVAASSLRATGVDTLADEIVSRLVPRIPGPGTPIPITPRQVKLLKQAQQRLAENDVAAFQRSVFELANPSERRMEL